MFILNAETCLKKILLNICNVGIHLENPFQAEFLPFKLTKKICAIYNTNIKGEKSVIKKSTFFFFGK